MWDQENMSDGMDAAHADFGSPASVTELSVSSNVLFICLKDMQGTVLADYSYTLEGVLTRIGE